jgi:hypothetical protein
VRALSGQRRPLVRSRPRPPLSLPPSPPRRFLVSLSPLTVTDGGGGGSARRDGARAGVSDSMTRGDGGGGAGSRWGAPGGGAGEPGGGKGADGGGRTVAGMDEGQPSDGVRAWRRTGTGAAARGECGSFAVRWGPGWPFLGPSVFLILRFFFIYYYYYVCVYNDIDITDLQKYNIF